MTNTDIKPVIILGAGRSGTKFLRDVILTSKEVSGIPYDINYVWRTGSEGRIDDELEADSLSKHKIVAIRKAIIKMSGVNNDRGDFLIEKTVGNTLRVPYVLKIFPEAKFIHLVRDGRAVTESAMRLWEAPPETGYLLKKLQYFPLKNYRYALSYLFNIMKGLLFSSRGQRTWGPIYSGLDEDLKNSSLFEICANQWYACVSKATRDLRLISAERVLTIRYEDLMLDDSTIMEVLDFIGIADKQVVVDLFETRKQISNLDKWKDKLSDEQVAILNDKIGDMLAYYHYD